MKIVRNCFSFISFIIIFIIISMLITPVSGQTVPEWTQGAYRQQHYPSQEWYVGYVFNRLATGANAANELDALKRNALSRLAESIVVTINSETSVLRKSIQRGEIDETSTDYSQAIQTATTATTVRTEVLSHHNTATGEIFAFAAVRRSELAAFYRRQLNVDLNKAETAVGISEHLVEAGKKMSARQKVAEARKALIDVYSYIDLLAAVSTGNDHSDLQIERTGDLMRTVERLLIDLEQSTFVYMNCSYEKRSAKDDAFGSDPGILCGIIAQALTENDCSITDSREEADYELTLITSTTQRSDGKTGLYPILSYYANARGSLYNRATQRRTVEFTILNNAKCYEAGNMPEDAATAAFNMPELRDLVLEKVLPRIRD